MISPLKNIYFSTGREREEQLSKELSSYLAFDSSMSKDDNDESSFFAPFNFVCK